MRMSPPSSSFVIKRVNSTTFLINEIDKYREHPLIYAKIHPAAPIIVLSDTGCDAPADNVKDADFVHLRPLLERYPVKENYNQPLNPGGERTYVIVLTHCHYDHIGGIAQFAADGKTEIISSAAGRDFIESDLASHSLCKHANVPVPVFKVTHWAQSFERLTWPLAKHLPGDVEDGKPKQSLKAIDLDIDIIHTPGHTPDELAWADLAERTVYVGDSFYQLGSDAMPIIFPPQGNLVDWQYSMQKLAEYLVFQLDAAPESIAEEDWALVPTSVKLSAAHQTVNQPAIATFAQLVDFWRAVVDGDRPVLYNDYRYGEVYSYWCSDFDDRGPSYGFALWCPRRLMDDLRRFFKNAPDREWPSPDIARMLRDATHAR